MATSEPRPEDGVPAVDDNRDGIPQPASGPMSREVAAWYVDFTDGQYQAVQDSDGQWYLHLPETQARAD